VYDLVTKKHTLTVTVSGKLADRLFTAPKENFEASNFKDNGDVEKRCDGMVDNRGQRMISRGKNRAVLTI
jgi:hypothetical protein